MVLFVLGLNGHPRFGDSRALSKGIERGTRLHATEETHACMPVNSQTRLEI